MLYIAYRDELGGVLCDVESETIEFFEGQVYFDDMKIDVKDVVRIGQKEN